MVAEMGVIASKIEIYYVGIKCVMKEYQFELEFSVRDYECDMQGIVNNAVYQNYLEHARHEFLKTRGVDFAELTRRGIHLVVIRVEIVYRHPLKSGDKFVVGIDVERESRLKFRFLQDIYRSPDHKPVVEAIVTGTAVNERGRPAVSKEIEHIMQVAPTG